jgi:hypothetical protein
MRIFTKARSVGAAAAAAVLLSGCSWFLPRPEQASNVIGDADTPQDGRCSLAVAQNRKSLPGQIVADGVPKLMVIHLQSPNAAARQVKFGQTVYFEASSSTDQETKPAQPIAARGLWRIESAQDQGAQVAEESVLMGGNTFLLSDPQGSGYVQLAGKALSLAAARSEASRFTVLKADVPDSTRPTSCDEQIRDEDFVFIRVLTPSMWVNVTATGMLEVRRTLPGTRSTPDASNANPLCAREEERCRTDSRGLLVCAWTPVCGD